MDEGFETLAEARRRLSGGKELTEHGAAAARLVAARGAQLKAEGWRRVDWPKDQGAAQPSHGGWIDHPYVLENGDQRFVYVSEHYGLTPGDLSELNDLVANGWNVTVGADRSLRLPGQTVAIWVERADPSTLYLHTGEPLHED